MGHGLAWEHLFLGAECGNADGESRQHCSTLTCDMVLQEVNPSHAPLNPAATQALGGPSKSKDPFADLASLGAAF